MKTSQLQLRWGILMALASIILLGCSESSPKDSSFPRPWSEAAVTASVDTTQQIIYNTLNCGPSADTCYGIRCNFPLELNTKSLHSNPLPIQPDSVIFKFQVLFYNLPGEPFPQGPRILQNSYCPGPESSPASLDTIFTSKPFAPLPFPDSIPFYLMGYELTWVKPALKNNLGGGICIILETMDPLMTSPKYDVLPGPLILSFSENTMTYMVKPDNGIPSVKACPDSSCSLPQ